MTTKELKDTYKILSDKVIDDTHHIVFVNKDGLQLACADLDKELKEILKSVVVPQIIRI